MFKFGDNPIIQGTYSGTVMALHDHGFRLPDAEEFLNRGSYECATAKERGIRDGLLKIGALRRNWLGRYKKTDAGY